ncbi:hypothetical protein [Effusibacillus dendaii]|nr:hypothetical protein [Effusibacillus dendaii]
MLQQLSQKQYEDTGAEMGEPEKQTGIGNPLKDTSFPVTDMTGADIFSGYPAETMEQDQSKTKKKNPHSCGVLSPQQSPKLPVGCQCGGLLFPLLPFLPYHPTIDHLSHASRSFALCFKKNFFIIWEI